MNQTSILMDMVVRSAQICALVVCLAGKMNKINSKYSGFIILNKMFNVKTKKKKKYVGHIFTIIQRCSHLKGYFTQK